jgi:hypothetical protein
VVLDNPTGGECLSQQGGGRCGQCRTIRRIPAFFLFPQITNSEQVKASCSISRGRAGCAHRARPIISRCMVVLDLLLSQCMYTISTAQGELSPQEMSS